MCTLLPCKRSKYLKQFVIISILQHSYCSQLLLCIASKGWKVAPRQLKFYQRRLNVAQE